MIRRMRWIGGTLWLAVACLVFSPASWAAEFQWQDAKGHIHRVQELAGEAVVLHLWASWCFPCREEMPELAAWMKAHPKIRVLPISLDESADAAKRFLRAIGMQVPLLRTTPEQLSVLGSRGLPTTVVIDRQGKIVSVHPGAQSWDAKWAARLRPLFDQG